MRGAGEDTVAARSGLSWSRGSRLGSALLSTSRQRKYTPRLWPMGSGTSRSSTRAAGSNSRTRNALSAASGKNICSASRCPRVMAKMRSARSTSSSVSGWLRWRERSMPSSASASTANSLAGWPFEAWMPAEATRTSGATIEQVPEQPLGHGAAATVAGADEEDVFHGGTPGGGGSSSLRTKRGQVKLRRICRKGPPANRNAIRAWNRRC